MTRLPRSLLGAWLLAATWTPGPTWAAEVAAEILGDLPELVALLPRRPGSGEVIGIQKVREMQQFMERKIEREVTQRYFPFHTRKSRPEMWREVTVEGRKYQVPNEGHPAYEEMARAYDARVRQNDAEFQARFGRRYEEFSRKVVGSLQAQRADAVQLIGKPQATHHSDLDATIRDPAVHQQVVEAFARHGLTVQDDPEGHGLYRRIEEVDWVLWQDRTLADLARTDPRYQAALADREVAGTNAGAREHLFGDGIRDGKGARLDYIKKYAQSRDGYTRNKIVGKLEDLDGVAPRARTAEAAAAMRDHQGATRALRLIGWPEPAKHQEEARFQAHRQEDLVDSYRRASLDHHAQQRQRNQMVAAYSDLARTLHAAGDATRAQHFADESRRLMRESATLTRTNAETMQAIEGADPALARRLRAADREAQAEHRRRAKVTAPPRGEAVTGDVALARALVDEGAAPPAAPVRPGAASRVLSGAQATFGHAGSVSKYLGIMDEALMHEAEGKGSALAYMAEKVVVDKAKDAALGYAARKVPLVGALVELADVPATLKGEFDREIDAAEAAGTSIWAAKGRAIVGTIKKATLFGTYEDILYEEGLEEVQRELETGRYDWGGIALRTAYRTTGEVTGINAGLRAIASSQEGVADRTREQRLALESLRAAMRARTLGSQADIDRLRDEIVELQLAPDADAPGLARQLARLQARHDAAVDQLHSMAKRIRRVTSTEDRQTEELYERMRLARQETDVARTRARMVRLVSAEDTAHPAVLDRLIRYREDHRRATKELQARCQDLFARRGADDPLVLEMQAKLRRAKEVQDRADAVDVSAELARGAARDASRAEAARDAWWADVEEGRRARQEELAGLRDALVAHARSGGATRGISPDDEALVPELEDLRMRQEAGEIPPDHDVLAQAYRNVARDAAYRDLRRRSEAGGLPEGTDLEALLARYDALEDGLEAGSPLSQAELLAKVVGGATPEEPPEVPPEDSGEDGTTPEEEPTEGPGTPESSRDPYEFLDGGGAGDLWESCCPPWVTRIQPVDGDPEAKGPRNGPLRRSNADGVLVSESWWKGGKRHGPERTFDSTSGAPRTERWYRDGAAHGPYRTWGKDGFVTEEGCSFEGEKPLDRRFFKGSRDVRTVAALDLARGEPRRRPRLDRQYLEDGSLQRQSRRDSSGKPEGLQVTTSTTKDAAGRPVPVVLEEVYGPDNLLRSRRERRAERPTLAEDFVVVGGEAVLDGERREWFPPGSPHAGEPLLEERYRAGVRDGAYRRHHPETGTRIAEGSFAQGVLDGAWRWTHPDGKPAATARFAAGFLEGALERFDVDGGRTEEFRVGTQGPTLYRRYRGGVLGQEFQGTLKARACSSPLPRRDPTPPGTTGCQPGLRFADVYGVVTGTLRAWVVDGPGRGKLHTERFYDAGEPTGTWRYAYPDGTPWVTERYQGGKLHGVQESRYPDGKPEYRVELVAGRRHGAYRHWNRQGVLDEDGRYRDGWLDGWLVRSYPTGEPQERSHSRPLEVPPPETAGGEPFGWRGLTRDVYGREAYGPRLRYRRDGTVQEVAFDRGNSATTKDPAEYLRWREQFPDLPELPPEVGGGAQESSSQAAETPDLSRVPAPAAGLDPEAAHMRMMELWGGANQASNAKDYARAEALALESVRLALAYPSEGPRGACIGYDKAAQAAERAGAAGRQKGYLAAALVLARELGNAGMVERYEAQLR